jgi:hypothetical protein
VMQPREGEVGREDGRGDGEEGGVESGRVIF